MGGYPHSFTPFSLLNEKTPWAGHGVALLSQGAPGRARAQRRRATDLLVAPVVIVVLLLLLLGRLLVGTLVRFGFTLQQKESALRYYTAASRRHRRSARTRNAEGVSAGRVGAVARTPEAMDKVPVPRGVLSQGPGGRSPAWLRGAGCGWQRRHCERAAGRLSGPVSRHTAPRPAAPRLLDTWTWYRLTPLLRGRHRG